MASLKSVKGIGDEKTRIELIGITLPEVKELVAANLLVEDGTDTFWARSKITSDSQCYYMVSTTPGLKDYIDYEWRDVSYNSCSVRPMLVFKEDDISRGEQIAVGGYDWTVIEESNGEEPGKALCNTQIGKPYIRFSDIQTELGNIASTLGLVSLVDDTSYTKIVDFKYTDGSTVKQRLMKSIAWTSMKDYFVLLENYTVGEFLSISEDELRSSIRTYREDSHRERRLASVIKAQKDIVSQLGINSGRLIEIKKLGTLSRQKKEGFLQVWADIYCPVFQELAWNKFSSHRPLPYWYRGKVWANRTGFDFVSAGGADWEEVTYSDIYHVLSDKYGEAFEPEKISKKELLVTFWDCVESVKKDPDVYRLYLKACGVDDISLDNGLIKSRGDM